MKFFRKLTAAVSAAVMMFSAASAADIASIRAEAADRGVYYYQGSQSEAELYIASQLEAYASQIDVSRYGLDFDTFEEILGDIILSRTDMFYVEPQFQYASNASGVIMAIKPKYYYQKETLDRRRYEMEAAANEIISGMDASWSDIQKTLYVHDIIAVNTKYDVGNDIRSAYEVLVGKNGLCVAYAMAYKYIMDKIGIECVIVMDSDINHSWNMVKINGKWYHVDVTWDDTIPNFEGLVYHDYFMVSDTKVKSGRNPHTGTITHGYTATDTSMDRMFWQSSAARMIPYNMNEWYYMNSAKGKLCKVDWSTGKITVIADIGMKWFSDTTRENCWLYAYTRIDRAGDLLYFNTRDAIYSYDLKTQKKQRLKRYSLSGTKALYGLRIRDGKLIVNTALSPTDKKFRTYSAFRISASQNYSNQTPYQDQNLYQNQNQYKTYSENGSQTYIDPLIQTGPQAQTQNGMSVQSMTQTAQYDPFHTQTGSQTQTNYQTQTGYQTQFQPFQSATGSQQKNNSSLMPPVNVSCSAENGKVIITWNASEGAEAYAVYEVIPETGETILLGTTSALAFEDGGVFVGRHWYAVKACGRSGNEMIYSELSQKASANL